MSSLFLIAPAVFLAAGMVLFAFGWNVQRRSRKEASGLRKELDSLQNELEIEQGKAGRLAGFIGRLQHFGVSPTGRIPGREFAEAFIDSISTLLKADQAVLFKIDEATLDFLPVAGRGIPPEILSSLRVRAGEGSWAGPRRG